MFPVRCFTCNKVLGHYWTQLEQFRRDHPHEEERDYVSFFQKLGLRRYCCKKIFMTYTDTDQEFDPSIHEGIIEIRYSNEIKKIVVSK